MISYSFLLFFLSPFLLNISFFHSFIINFGIRYKGFVEETANVNPIHFLFLLNNPSTFVS